ncbi:MAG: metallophosphoesterase, partial [Nitrospirae bacterium]|nr:metallophosphoesterase [Nitrospirota bacterium]
MKGTNLRLLHISDLHLQATDDRNIITKIFTMYKDNGLRDEIFNYFSKPFDENTLEALAKLAYDLRSYYDVILISGDTAHTASVKNLASARRFIDNPYSNAGSDNTFLNDWGEPTLSSCGKPIIIVPGNHDRFESPNYLPGHNGYPQFNDVFHDYWHPGNNVQGHVIYYKRSPQLAVICVDFSLKSPDHSKGLGGSWWGQGKVYEDELNLLKSETYRIRREYRCDVLWMF